MESEVYTLKRRYFESRQQGKAMKQTVRVQRDKCRQLITACAYKLQEKEAEIERLQMENDQALATIARELTFLQANMLKEQQRLESIIADQSAALEMSNSENERLRKANKKLQQNSKLLSLLGAEDRDMDTPSSEDSSPKSSFSSKASTKIEIKPRNSSTTNNEESRPPLLLGEVESVGPSAAGASSSGGPPPATLPRGSGPLDRRPPPPPPPPPPSSENQSPSQKPPVPSRAGVNRKLLRGGGPATPPQPPARSTSLRDLERVDSGRESDDNHMGYANDEGFCSSHEDNNNSSKNYNNYLDQAGLQQKSIVSPSRQLTNHRAVQKPSDIKYRSKLKSSVVSSNLAVLEEHQVTDGGGQVTTVTYWTEPYL